jgi:membrane-associated protease RseP (regulator of RpoE activity)
LGEEGYQRLTFKYGLLMARTKRGLSLLDKFGSFRISKPLAWAMLYMMPIAGGVALYFILSVVAIFFSPQGAAVIEYIRTITPLANVLLPGINPYVPILYGWIALVVAVFIHEASHGIVARSLNMPVKAAGVLFFLIIPIGAFVEVDDTQLRTARARDSTRMLAAGSGINMILALISLALLILAVSTMTPATRGAAIAGVVPNSPQVYSPAAVAGIKPGDFVTAINGKPVTDLSQLFGGSRVFSPGQIVNISLWRNGQTILLRNVTLGQITYLNTRTNQTFTDAFLGVEETPYQGLQSVVATYSTQYTRDILAYVAWLPTFPRSASFVPFSDSLVVFYRSPLGVALPFVTNLLFWLWFVNFNLAIFNSLPMYPMDGGQAFEIAVKSVGRGRISENLATRITAGATIAIVAILLIVIVGPYLSGISL